MSESKLPTKQVLQAIQNELGRLHGRYPADSIEAQALSAARAAVYVAWYIVARGWEGGKFGILESEFEVLKDRLGFKNTEREDRHE